MKELLVFDLDGTLLNAQEQLSDATRFALGRLDHLGVDWTIATGRMPHGVKQALAGVPLRHPQVYKNGVLIWDLIEDQLISKIAMEPNEVVEVCQRLIDHGINPWLSTLNDQDQVGAVFKAISTAREQNWLDYLVQHGVYARQSDAFHQIEDEVLHVFAVTDQPSVLTMAEQLADLEGVTVFAGHDMYNRGHYWLDVHHTSGTKGDAAKLVQQQLGAQKLICFGDSDNDISMFEQADEAYALGQGLDELKAIATEVIGHHDEDGIARFLAQRYGFELPRRP